MERTIGRSTLMLLLVGVAFAFLVRASVAGAPGQFQFQSRLTDGAGKPLPDGNVSIAFKIFAADPATTPNQTPLWTETQPTVAIARGIVSVQLGSVTPINAAIFDGSTKYLELAVNGNAPLRPTIPLVSVPYAMSAGSINGKPESQVAPPVGTIVDWFPPTRGANPPDGWRICDGSQVTNEPSSPYNNSFLPDLRQKFTRGIDSSLAANLGSAGPGAPPSLPDVGGASAATVTLPHNHSIQPHQHTLPAHTHTGTTGRPVGVQVPLSGVFFFQQGPVDHVHDFTTNPGGDGVTGSGGTSATDPAAPSTSVPTVPPCVGLLKIIKIR